MKLVGQWGVSLAADSADSSVESSDGIPAAKSAVLKALLMVARKVGCWAKRLELSSAAQKESRTVGWTGQHSAVRWDECQAVNWVDHWGEASVAGSATRSADCWEWKSAVGTGHY